MTSNAIKYAELKEAQRHNLELESQGRSNLELGKKSTQAALMQASAAQTNASAAWMNAETNRTNADTNLVNATTRQDELTETVRHNTTNELISFATGTLKTIVGAIGSIAKIGR